MKIEFTKEELLMMEAIDLQMLDIEEGLSAESFSTNAYVVRRRY